MKKQMDFKKSKSLAVFKEVIGIESLTSDKIIWLLFV